MRALVIAVALSVHAAVRGCKVARGKLGIRCDPWGITLPYGCETPRSSCVPPTGGGSNITKGGRYVAYCLRQNTSLNDAEFAGFARVPSGSGLVT